MRSVCLLGICFLVVAASLTVGLADEATYSPTIAPASNEGQQAISRIRVPEGFQVELWAAEPMLANPVAFCFDTKGRVYVAETFRQKKSVLDNRDFMHWVDDDLAAMTVEDRLVYFRKHLGAKVEEFRKDHDRIRLLEDRDGDGKADHATVFADGFNEILDGTGAGVLARGKDVWYTNIPHLWHLRDNDGDGKAEVRESLQYGYGVRVALRGHDSHGLRFGPDGKLYFSIGDRGFNVPGGDGKRLVYPDQGAVLRCNPDGSELEVFAAGLRNPQELAFDEYGNLFTCDNNSDSGDQARWTYLVEGGETGWRMSFQYIGDRGPWNREKLWHPQHEGQPAFIVPPIANIADGPSGLTYNPGTGFPEKYARHFFLCDFRGGHGNSGVRSFAVKPKGASFDLVDSQEFAWSILCTDADFGPDGALYISDWVEGWDGPGKGRLYRVVANDAAKDARVADVRRLLNEGFSQRPKNELAKLLAHPNMQVRLEAQFALAERGPDSIGTLEEVASKSDVQLARVHAVWGLGQIGRKDSKALDTVVALLADRDAEVRAQAAKTLGNDRYAGAKEKLAGLLADAEPRVRFFAAIALGRVGAKGFVPALATMLRENADADPYLRHAAVMGLASISDPAQLEPVVTDAAPAVRLGTVVALRRLGSPGIARFLDDSEPRIVEEAARAISDVPIVDAFPQLAAIAGRSGLTEPTLWRVINANFRLGDQKNADAVARLAARADIPEALRIEATRALEGWAQPSGRDRVLGLWRPLPKRDAKIPASAFSAALGGILSGPEKVRQAATQAAVKLGIKEVGPALLQLLTDKASSPQTRREAVKALRELNDARLSEAAEIAVKDENALVRAEGRRALAKLDPAGALKSLLEALKTGKLPEQQAALETLAEMKQTEADAGLATAIGQWESGTLPVELQLDLAEAVKARGEAALSARVEKLLAPASDDPLAPFRLSLAGGDADRGRQIFFEKSAVSCVRCHKVQGRGGDVGPDLSKVGSQQKRDYLLESLVLPDKQIAKGFEPVVIVTDKGKVFNGTIKQDDGTNLTLVTAEGALIVIPKAEIDEQARGKSAMPEDIIKKLTLSETRDLLEFLANLK